MWKSAPVFCNFPEDRAKYEVKDFSLRMRKDAKG